MSELRDLQNIFIGILVPRLLSWCHATGRIISAGELWRPPEMVQIYVTLGKGSKTSLHPDRLALDLNYFVDDKLATWDQYLPIGEYWESLHPDACWGGRFTHLKDAPHFSLSYQGRR